MERLTQLELKKIVSTAMKIKVFAIKKDEMYQVALDTDGQSFVIKSQRDDIRLFKSISAVQNMLNSVGIVSFTVLG